MNQDIQNQTNNWVASLKGFSTDQIIFANIEMINKKFSLLVTYACKSKNDQSSPQPHMINKAFKISCFYSDSSIQISNTSPCQQEKKPMQNCRFY